MRQIAGAQQLPSVQGEPTFPQQTRVLGLVVVTPQSLFEAQHSVAALHARPAITQAATPPPAPPDAPPPLAPPDAPPALALPPEVDAPPALPPAEPPEAAPPAVPPGLAHAFARQLDPAEHARHCAPDAPHDESSVPAWQVPVPSQHPSQVRESQIGITPHDAIAIAIARKRSRMAPESFHAN